MRILWDMSVSIFQYVSLPQIQFDPFEYFNFPLPASAGSLPDIPSVGALNNYLGAWGESALVGYSFEEDMTPYVEHVSVRNGTTAGGTTVLTNPRTVTVIDRSWFHFDTRARMS